jgi:hypothetical protein
MYVFLTAILLHTVFQSFLLLVLYHIRENIHSLGEVSTEFFAQKLVS